MATPRVRLGELLVRAGLLTATQLDEALAEQKRNGKRLGSLLVESGLVSETQVTQVLSQQLSVPWVALHHIEFSRELLNLVPVDIVERYCLIPIYVRRLRGIGDALYVAMEDPTNTQALDEVAKHSGLHVRPMIAPPNDILSAIHAYYGVGTPPREPARPLRGTDVEAHVSTGLHQRVDAEAAERMLAEAEATRAAASAPETKSSPTVPANLASPGAARPNPGSSPQAAARPNPGSSPQAAARPNPGSSPKASREAPSSPSSPSGDPPPSSRAGGDTKSQRAARKMIALTLLDGTQIRVPAKPGVAPEAAATPKGDELTARDLVAALRAAGRGVDASEILGDNVRWESVMAAVLSLLLKKHLIADWEFVEEFRKS